MAFITVTNTFVNATTASASEVNTNFTDIINGTSDGTKDFSIAALTCSGTLTANGNVTLGNASSDDLTVTASLASSIPIKTTASYDIGASTLGLRALYLGLTTFTTKLATAATSTYTFTFPAAVPSTASAWLLADTSANITFGHTTTRAKVVDGSADEVQFNVQGHATQTSNIFTVEKSDATNLVAVTNVNGTKIRGTTTNDSAATGFIGEYVESVVSTSASIATSAQWGDITTISLTAGDWDISALYYFDKNGGTVTNTEYGIGTASGNSSTGLTLGTNYSAGGGFVGDGGGASIPCFRVSISSTTSYYLKVKMSYSVATPKAAGRISARRVR